MTSDDERSKNVTHRDEFDSIPLWRALAQFTSDDRDEGRKSNKDVINREYVTFQMRYSIISALCIVFGALGFAMLLFLVIVVLVGGEVHYALFLLVMFFVIVGVAPRAWLQIYQYRVLRLDEPLPLPHKGDDYFDEFLNFLQNDTDIKAYYFSRFGKARKYLDRSAFLGNLRYLLFSEHAEDRRLVMRFRTGRALPSDIFIDRLDLEKMRELRNSKPKAPSGVWSKYHYEDAIVAVLGSAEIKDLSLSNREKALGKIREMIVDWFKQNPQKDGKAPRDDYPRVRESAEKIYTVLKNLSDR